MKAIRALILISILVLLAGPLRSVQADDPSPWGEFLNPDGTVQWDKLVDLGTASEPASWMDVTLPGGLVVHQDATYHRYRTPSGNVLVLPEPITLFFMAQHPAESGLNNAQSMLGNGASILTLLVGGALTPEQLANLASKGYTDPLQFFQAVIDGKEDIWSLLNLNFLGELVKMSLNSGFLVNALFLYLNGATDCAAIPGGCAGLLAGLCPNGDCSSGHTLPTLCPASTTSQAAPTLVIEKIAPDHPLVIGQDPQRRGADIQAAVSIPPVVFTWYEPVQDPPVCRNDGSGGGNGCPGPASRYSGVFDAGGASIGWSSSLENNPAWKVVDGSIHCKKHVDLLRDAVTALQATAALSPQSRVWILNDLAGKYYEAYLHRPDFNLVPGLATMTAACGGNGVCTASALVPNVPFADPGTFDLKLVVHTSGTVFHYHGTAVPITSPRVLFEDNTLQVFVTLVTLIPAGAP